MATARLLGDLAARVQENAPLSVAVESIGGVDAAKRVRRGEAVDIVVLAAGVIDELIAEGHVAAASRTDIARSAIAVAVRAGGPRPDISSADGVKAAVLSAATVGYSTGPSGTHLQRLFAQWGIVDELAPRIVVAPPGVPVAALIARGDIALGFQQLSEFAGVDDIDVVGQLPPDIQMVTTFSGGIASTSSRRDDARVVLDFMAAPAAADIKRTHGMEPA
jgi:molybdate transport system substrate-binding protein